MMKYVINKENVWGRYHQDEEKRRREDNHNEEKIWVEKNHEEENLNCNKYGDKIIAKMRGCFDE